MPSIVFFKRFPLSQSLYTKLNLQIPRSITKLSLPGRGKAMLSPDFFQSLRANFIQYKPIEEKGRKRIKLDDSKQSSTSNSQNNVVMLYKNDLRTIDNPALYYASKYAQSNNGNVIGLFAFCEQELRVHNYGESKIALIAKSVNSLKETLDANFNIPLFIVEVEKAEKVPEAICTFCLDANASALFYNKQYELDESTRDSIVHDALTNIYGLNCFSFDDQCAVPPGTCTTQQGKQYAVFTPYKKCWLKILQETNKKLLDMAPLPISNVKGALKSLKFSLEVINQIQFASKIADRYECNEKRVNQLANEFISKKATNYMKKRDFPALDGTSELSPYIALGMISIRSLINQAKQANNGNLAGSNEGLTCWVSELCWRDFYRNIVVAFPHVMKNQPFKLESKNIAWNNNQETFKRWTQGLTGYPIVDAGMRQLNATGWMHNRVRMITATFLVKDLLVSLLFQCHLFCRLTGSGAKHISARP